MLLTEISKQALQKLYHDTDFSKSDKHFLQQDTNFFSDALGKDWMRVKNTDYYTLALAAIDGIFMRYIRTAALNTIIKTHSTKKLQFAALQDENQVIVDKFGNDLTSVSLKDLEAQFEPYYEAFIAHNIYTISDFEKFFQNKANLMRFLRNVQHDTSSEIYNVINNIVTFLQNAAEQKFVTVYRGISINHDQLLTWYKHDKLIKSNPLKVLQYVDNTAKEFNSYSTNLSVAEDFAKHTQNGRFYEEDLSNTPTHDYIIISGKAAKHNINFAFSAYLAGKSLSTAEQELSINGYSPLTDLRVVQYKFNLDTSADFFKKQKKFGKCIAHIDNTYVFDKCITDSQFNIIINNYESYRDTTQDHVILCSRATTKQRIYKFYLVNTITNEILASIEDVNVNICKKPFIIAGHMCYYVDDIYGMSKFYDSQLKLIFQSQNDRKYYFANLYNGDDIPFTANDNSKILVCRDGLSDTEFLWLDSATLNNLTKYTNIKKFHKSQDTNYKWLAECVESNYKYCIYRIYNEKTDTLLDRVKTDWEDD